jgi:GntR family transcriptional regulator, transcriptional repressor for pyruvate dehydrogenase complex
MAHGLPASAGLLAQQLDSPTRVDEITDRLITAIAIGEYLPGTRLPVERELAQSLRVGRMTVRAALARLVEQGLLETRRGRGGGSYVVDQWSASSTGAVVRTLGTHMGELRDRCDAICRLQGSVARAAAECRTDADVLRLRGTFEDYRDAATGLAAQQADSRFHLAIMDAAHNDVLKQVLLDLLATVSIGAPAHLWGESDTMRSRELRALDDHAALVDAISEGRGDDADALSRAHGAIDFEVIVAAMERANAPAQ